MKRNPKQTLIAVITFIGGLYFFLEFILPKTMHGFEFGLYHDQISKGVQIVGSMAIGIGIINILMVHCGKIIKGKKGTGSSTALIIGLAAVVVIYGSDLINAESQVAAWKQIANLELFAERIKSDFEDKKLPAAARVTLLGKSVKEVEKSLDSKDSFFYVEHQDAVSENAKAQLKHHLAQAGTHAAALEHAYQLAEQSQEPLETNAHDALIADLHIAAGHARTLTALHYENLPARTQTHFVDKAFYESLAAAMFSLLAFYIATAAYRSFRIRSLESSVMMLAALVIILGQIPQGPLYIWSDLPEIRRWLMENLNTPAFRAIFFGSSIAGLAMAVRMWLSLERSPLASDE